MTEGVIMQTLKRTRTVLRRYKNRSNCTIDLLDLQGKFFSDVEKMPFISKFEFFLRERGGGKVFDRGCKEVQAISELKSIRDLYVHPKVSSRRYEKISEYVWNADYGETSLLKFPREPRMWKVEHAILAIKSVNDFFNKYYLNWCDFNEDQIVDMLLSRAKVDLINRTGAGIDCVNGLNRAVKEWDIDFKFIGKKI